MMNDYIQKDMQKLLQITNEIGQEYNPGKFTPKNAKLIYHGEVGYTHCSNEEFILGTFGAGPCVILALYNPKTTTAAISHMDDITDIEKTIDSMTNKLGREGVKAHIRGGNSSSHNDLITVIETLSQKNIEIKSAEIITKTIDEGAINACTGDFYTHFSPFQLDDNPRDGLNKVLRWILQHPDERSIAKVSFDGIPNDIVYDTIQEDDILV